MQPAADRIADRLRRHHGLDLFEPLDLKADRQAATLIVQNAHLEDGADSQETAVALAKELQSLAQWLGLEQVEAKKANAFEKTLASVI